MTNLICCYNREEAEKDMTFLGLIVMENKLKPESIKELHKVANTKIRTPVITGDTVFTAVSVSKECSIIPRNARVLIPEVFEGQEHSDIVWKELPDNNIDYSDAPTEIAITGPAFALLRAFTNEKQRVMYHRVRVFYMDSHSFSYL